jgi:trk system potassium uptake protein TrkH
MLNIKILFRAIGSLFLVETGMFLVCLIMSLCYGETDTSAFLYSALIAFFLGFVLKYLGRNSGNSLSQRDAFLIVTLTWIIFSLMGMLPLLFTGACTNTADAFLENMSGFTTTGVTILSNIDSLPHGTLFWRSMTHWIGGLGIIFFTIAILPTAGESNIRLFSAEATGPTHEKLHPRISTTAKWMFSLYFLLTLACAFCLWLAGMNVFDSINHAMSTTATGGFSTHSDGIMFYHSPAIEYVEIVFMFLSGINFPLLYLIFKRKSITTLIKNNEFDFYLLTVLAVSAVAAIALVFYSKYPVERAIRAALFNVISVQTTTGFVSENFSLWWRPFWICLFFSMVTGSCAGSTAGGIKCVRMLTLFKTAMKHFRQLLHPNAFMLVRVNHTTVTETIERSLLAFLFWYFALIVIGTFALSAMSVPIFDSINIITSCISNIGAIDGNVYSPITNIYTLPACAKWVCSFMMLAGRLEIFPILLPLLPSFWENN